MRINQNFLQNILTSLIVSFTVVGFAWAFTGPGANQPPNGDVTFWSLNGTKMYYNSGNVGIGTTNPTSTLTVAGQIWSTTGGFKFPDATTQTSAASGVPSGAVMFFNLSSCPTGWSEYTALRGRIAVGLPSGGTLAGNNAASAYTDKLDRTHTHTIPRVGNYMTPGDWGDWTGPTDPSSAGVPTHQLLACSKD